MSRKPANLPLFLLLLCLCLGLAALISCVPADSSAIADTEENRPATEAKIQWQAYRNAAGLSREQDKKVYLYFFADWCRYCTMMEKTTFADASVISRLNRYFIPVMLKLEDHQELAREYAVQGVPASWFLEINGENIGGRPGYLPPDKFIELLDVVIAEAYKN